MPTKTAGPAASQDGDPLVSREYGQLLKRTYEALTFPDKPGLKEFIEKRTPVSYPTAWRVWKGEGSIEAATAIRRALIDHGADATKLPMPVVASSLERSADGEEIDRWCAVGRRWLKLDPDGFAAAIDELEEDIKARERVAKGMSLIKNPLPRRKG